MIWILCLARAAQLWPLTITIAARPDSTDFTKICRSAGSTAACRIDIGPVLEVQIRKCPGILAQRGNTMIKDIHGTDLSRQAMFWRRAARQDVTKEQPADRSRTEQVVQDPMRTREKKRPANSGSEADLMLV